MALAGISPTGGLMQILPDGTRKTVEPDDPGTPGSGVAFKRRPRVKQG